MLTQSRLASASRLRTAALAPGLRARLAVSLVAAAVVLLACGGAAAAAPLAQITEFSTGLNAGGSPAGIAPGPDGNLWFTDRGTTKAIGRITPSGSISEFSTGLNAGSGPAFIAPGRDGKLWFTDQGTTPAIGRITPSGSITEFDQTNGLNAGSIPEGIAPGADGNLWFTDRGSTKAIGRITPSGSITEFDQTNGLNAGSSPEGIAPGPDGNLWFTDFGTTKAIGRITPNGSITEFSTDPGRSPVFIAAGPDGNLWFTEQSVTTRAIGRITPSGSITEFSTGLNAGSIPVGIAPGADRNLWFADVGTTAAIGRIGTGAPAASQTPPEVTGSGQAGTRQSCLGDRWADWAGVPPSSAPFAFAGFDGYQWLLDGKPLLGKTGRSYSPTSAQVGHLLSCRLTVTYPLPLIVTTSATSPAVRVLTAAPKPPPPSLPCVVPNVTGKKLAKAKAAITDAHCKVGKITKKKSSVKPGRVLSQKPGAGAVRPGGSKVALVVSKH